MTIQVELARNVLPSGLIINYPKSVWLDRSLGSGGYTEKRNVEYARTIIQPGWKVADVGTFVGEMAMHWRDLYSVCHMFEAIPETANIAEMNIRDNSLDKVVLHRAAVGDAVGELTFVYSGGSGLLQSSANKKLGKRAAANGTAHQVTVPCVTLDSVGVDFDYVKVDVEGLEPAVIAGSSNLIATKHPVFQLELLEENLKRSNMCCQDVLDLMASIGYTRATDNRGVKLDLATMRGKDGWFFHPEGPQKEAGLESFLA